MKRILSVALTVLCVALGSRAAWSCSVTENFLWPSNFELAQKADDIVLARATSAQKPRGPYSSESISFQVLRTLKGRYPNAIVKTRGTSDLANYGGSSKPDDFSRARPGNYGGMCSAHDYAISYVFLLFLMRHKQHHPKTDAHGRNPDREEGWEWSVGVSILARDREQVAPKGDPWVRAVEEYVRVSGLPHAERAAALRELAARAREEKDDLSLALAKDIDAHFTTVSASKSYAELQALRAAGAPEAKIMAAFEQGVHPQAFDELMSYHARRNWVPLQYLERVRDPRRVRVLVDHFLKLSREPLGEQSANDREEQLRYPASALAKVADASHAEQMLEVLRASNHKEHSGEVIARWFMRHPSAAALAVMNEKTGGTSPRWNLPMAALGDRSVLKWIGQPVTKDLIYHVPLMMAFSPFPEADAWIRGVFARRDFPVMLRLLHDLMRHDPAYEWNPNPRRADRLRDLVEIAAHDPRWRAEMRAFFASPQRYGLTPEQKFWRARLEDRLLAESRKPKAAPSKAAPLKSPGRLKLKPL